MWRKSSYSADVSCVEMRRKSSYSMHNGNCVEFRSAAGCGAGECVEFATSTRSELNGACVEVAACACAGPHVALVRDSKLVDAAGNNTSPVLSFEPGPWMAFIRWAPGLRVDA